ncbi:hypothetical protein K504DRAFT_458274 [Pleomassaria siparia CBS 279.74]|uniref:Uncharacterized protein n=1 Tax=Pleomassaria siparia CBS 279.74 TaxID=1314801 RepID=A0A6G1K5S4_9PLEO|nr:hypothetical protein K504DRAFT_458274 [Pleomassaria siparia CBS 279.74]
MRFQQTFLVASVLAMAAAKPCKPVVKPSSSAAPPVTSAVAPPPIAVPTVAPVATEPAAPVVAVSAAGGITAEKIIQIAPTTASCAGAEFPDECADAAAAAPAISNSFTQYKLTEVGEQAAVVSLMLFESGSFKYNKNHFPGVVGQGTRNMQSPAFNALYAAAIGVADPMADNDSSFGSAAWFLTTQCSADVRAGLVAGTPAGYSAYLTQCVGTTDTADRDTIWAATIAAMKG